jgi:hypothetical protein
VRKGKSWEEKGVVGVGRDRSGSGRGRGLVVVREGSGGRKK